MALMLRCPKHDISYIAPDIRSEEQRGKPLCPMCRDEWYAAHPDVEIPAIDEEPLATRLRRALGFNDSEA